MARPYRLRAQHFSRCGGSRAAGGGRGGTADGGAPPAAVPLLVLAAVAVVVPAAMATGPGLAAVEATIRTLPGLGVLRDAQKWVALAVPGYALAGAAAVVTLRHRLPAAATALVCCAALVADVARPGLGRRRQGDAVHYPPAGRRSRP